MLTVATMGGQRAAASKQQFSAGSQRLRAGAPIRRVQVRPCHADRTVLRS